MAVIFKCKHCGKQYQTKTVFQGNLIDAENWFKEKTNEISQKCKCQGGNK